MVRNFDEQKAQNFYDKYNAMNDNQDFTGQDYFEDYELGDNGVLKVLNQTNVDSTPFELTMNNNIALQELYHNYVNSVVCGNPIIECPWNYNSTKAEVNDYCLMNENYNLLHQLELLEDKCLSMNLDPTNGLFAQVKPGTRFLSSPYRVYFINGIPTQDTIDSAKELDGMINFKNTGEFNSQIDDSGIIMSNDNNFLLNNYVMFNQQRLQNMSPIQHNYKTVPGSGLKDFHGFRLDFDDGTPSNLPEEQQPQDLIELPQFIPFLSVRSRDEIAADQSLSIEEKNKEVLENNKKIEAYNKAMYWEYNKQAIYDETQDLLKLKNRLIGQLNSIYIYNGNMINNIKNQIANIDNKIAYYNDYNQSRFSYITRQQWDMEMNMLYLNYLIANRNRAVFRMQEEESNRLASIYFPELVDISDSKYKDNVELMWEAQFGRPMTRDDRYFYTNYLDSKAMIQQKLDKINLRNQARDFIDIKRRMWINVKVATGKMTEEEANNYWYENDPMGVLYIFNNDPRLQTESSIRMRMENRTKDEEFEDYIPIFGKRYKDLTDREKRKLYFINQSNELAHYGMRDKYSNDGKDRPIMINNWRCPTTIALMESQGKNLNDTLRKMSVNCSKVVNTGMNRMRKLDYYDTYDHDEFNRTLDNYARKTRIGQLSDLLSEYEDNSTFKEAMNRGLLHVLGPNELDMADYTNQYNKDRIEFDNSIIESMHRQSKYKIPKEAYVKDPDKDTYNGESLDKIQNRLTKDFIEQDKDTLSYVTPELGGTYQYQKSGG